MSEDKNQVLFRASTKVNDVVGRTLSGIALPWDTPTRVQDKVGPSYIEAHSAHSMDVSMRQHDAFPIFVRHDYMADPIGMTRFYQSPSEQALLYETNPLAQTRRADEMLELVNDGSMRSVSVGFRPIQALVGRMLGGQEVDKYRTENALKELSLAPTGFGQYAEAKVLSVRQAQDADEDPFALIAAVDAILDAACRCLDPTDDDYNVAQAADLLTAAEATVDTLMAMFGIPDPDDNMSEPAPEEAVRASIQVNDIIQRIATTKAKQPEAAILSLAELQQRKRSISLPSL